MATPLANGKILLKPQIVLREGGERLRLHVETDTPKREPALQKIFKDRASLSSKSSLKPKKLSSDPGPKT